MAELLIIVGFVAASFGLSLSLASRKQHRAADIDAELSSVIEAAPAEVLVSKTEVGAMPSLPKKVFFITKAGKKMRARVVRSKDGVMVLRRLKHRHGAVFHRASSELA